MVTRAIKDLNSAGRLTTAMGITALGTFILGIVLMSIGQASTAHSVITLVSSTSMGGLTGLFYRLQISARRNAAELDERDTDTWNDVLLHLGPHAALEVISDREKKDATAAKLALQLGETVSRRALAKGTGRPELPPGSGSAATPSGDSEAPPTIGGDS